MKLRTQTWSERHLKEYYFGLSIVLALLLGLSMAHEALAVTPTPLAGLQFVKIITIPTWTNTGATQTSTDVFSFDPSTHTMYFADRVNKGVSVIDTTTNTYLGTLVVPTCDGTGSCPSGVLVAPDLHKLVVTDRLIGAGNLNHIFIYDLRILSAPPVTLTVTGPVGSQFQTDELDYDPLNHRAYVANSLCPCFLTVVDLVTNTIVDQIPLPANLEQPRFNPVDGMIYVTMPDDLVTPTGGANDAVVKIDPTKTGAAAIVGTFPPPAGCAVRGIDIDPLTNTGIIGCGLGASQYLLDFATGSVLAQFPGVTGTDTLAFNRNLRRWYTASSNNTNSGVLCPQDSTTAFPVIGVFAAPKKKNQIATIVGAECSGRNGHGVGVEPFDNQVYTGVRQFPADPASATTGTRGVLVLVDPAPLAQPHLASSNANLLANGKVHILNSHIVQAKISNLPSSQPTLLNVTTTVGNEVVECDVSGTSGTCFGILKGQALIGGVVFLATGGAPVASAPIK